MPSGKASGNFHAEAVVDKDGENGRFAASLAEREDGAIEEEEERSC